LSFVPSWVGSVKSGAFEPSSSQSAMDDSSGET